MKHVGLNVAADPLFSSAYTGVNGGLVVVVGTIPPRTVPRTSRTADISRGRRRSDARTGGQPGSEGFDAGAFEMSERFDTPVLVRLTTRLCHSKTVVNIDPKPYQARRGNGFVKDFDKYVLLPRQAVLRHTAIENRLIDWPRMVTNWSKTGSNCADRKLGIVTSGVAYCYVREAFPEASVLKLTQTFPAPRADDSPVCRGGRGSDGDRRTRSLPRRAIRAMGINLASSKWRPLVGELTPETDPSELRTSEPQATQNGDTTIRPRAPRICAGCQYWGSTRRLPDWACASRGILGVIPWDRWNPGMRLIPLSAWERASERRSAWRRPRLKPREKILAIIGDGTLLHSGISSLMDMVYNQGIRPSW